MEDETASRNFHRGWTSVWESELSEFPTEMLGLPVEGETDSENFYLDWNSILESKVYGFPYGMGGILVLDKAES